MEEILTCLSAVIDQLNKMQLFLAASHVREELGEKTILNEVVVDV